MKGNLLQFAYPAAFGDLLAALLALASIPAVAQNGRSGRLLVWVFNVEGSLDLVAAIALATVYEASAFMRPAYWIPAFWVPALLQCSGSTRWIQPAQLCGDSVRSDGNSGAKVEKVNQGCIESGAADERPTLVGRPDAACSQLT